jgi:CheY-like chemotaxis protein
VASNAPRRKVLIIEDEPSIRNVLYVLLAGIGCDAETVSSGAEAMALVARQKFDALLLDLRCSNVQPEEVVGGVQRLRPSLVGRVLVVTGEVADQKSLDLIDRNFLLHVPRNRLEEVRGIVSAMLRIAPSAKTPS